MNEAFLAPDERVRNVLRAAIADFGQHMARLSPETTQEDRVLHSVEMDASWQRLVLLIQPDPDPIRRPCPHCQGPIMQQATRCKYCLEASAPPARELAH